jgi:xylulokinase
MFLGIDVGTTATKALLLDPERGVVAEEVRDSRLESIRPGWAEEDPQLWWRNVCELTRQLGGSGTPSAVGVSGMVPCVILLDRHSRPLRSSIQQNDARAVAEIEEMRVALADSRIMQRTGSAITQQSVGPKLMWLARHEPAVWSQAAHVLGSYDYVVSRLTGSLGVEANWALESGLFDLETGRWADDALAAAGIRAALLPPVRGPIEVVGHVSAVAAAETGLPEGLPVVAGSADHVAAAFAAGVIDEGDTLVKLGGAADILMASERSLIDERLYLDFHLVPGRFLPNGCMATGGTLIRWFQAELGQGKSLAALDAEAEAAGPGSGGLVMLPYFLGEKTPINDPRARGAIVGLHLGHRRGHLFRALLEGVAYGLRHHLDVFEELGHAPARVRVSDGGGASTVWTQIIADVVGRPLQVLDLRGGAALGAAFLAGKAAGGFSGWREVERFVTVAREVAPTRRDEYEEGYATYRQLYPALKRFER